MESAKVLLVDDDPSVLEGYRRGLRKQFRLVTALSGKRALAILSQSSDYAVVISDMRMPLMSGLQLLSKVREINPDTVRIMLTGDADQQTVIDAINQGEIYKFLSKPCDTAAMGEAIAEGIKRYQQATTNRKLVDKSISKAKVLAQQLSYQAEHDNLTGLYTRQSFEDRLMQALGSAQNQGVTHAVCYLDLDHLHIINDSFGAETGDLLLQQVATVLKRGRRHNDTVARLGGDEFAILLIDCNMQQARKIVEGLHQEICAINLEKDGMSMNASACLGLTPINGEDSTAATILLTAEAACGLARERGLNILHVADENDQELRDRLGEVLLVSDINLALEQDNFKLYYQDIVRVNPDGGEGRHYELLLRMADKEGNIFSPDSFLPAAEHYYLMPKIDCWVIRSCAKKLAKNRDLLQKLSVCSINLSGLSLGSSEVLECIKESFCSDPVPPEKICFEITETAAITRLEIAKEFISKLKSQGFLFALDDFGSGYSSFAYLRDLPIDFLKIDGAFVKNMDSDKLNRVIVKTISELGQAMGIETIAEFVENQAIHRCLKELKVDYAQGYLISKPLPWEDL
jgi:diguanylate cyclase (GGDEF)-like protein